MGAAFLGVDIVDKGKETFRITRVVLETNLNFNVAIRVIFRWPKEQGNINI